MIIEAVEMIETVIETVTETATETVIGIVMEEIVTEDQTTDIAVKAQVALLHHPEMDQKHLVDAEA